MSGRLVDPARVKLDLVAGSRDEAVRAVAELLRGDARIGSWEDFWKSVGPKQVVDLKGFGCGVCLAHGRDGTVKELAFAAARLSGKPDSTLPRFVFVFAIPAAMAEDYLRAVGALARACGEANEMQALGKAQTPEALAAALEDILA